MTARTWTIQLIGGLLILLLATLAIPLYTQIIPDFLLKNVKQTLHDNGLKWVKLSVDDRNITLSGTAPSIDDHNTVLQLTRSNWLVRNIQDNISPKLIEPYTLNMYWNGDSLQIIGYLTDDKKKALFLEKLQALYKNHNADKLNIGAGAPEAWDNLTLSLLQKIHPLTLASVNISDKKISVSGKAESNSDIEAFKQAMTSFSKKGYDISINLLSLDTPLLVCKEKFHTLLETEKIQFDSGLATVSPQSTNLLHSLGNIISLCPDTKITIIGHTDNTGNENSNLAISEKRAEAILANLFQQGIPLERMKAIGKGSTNPIATNTTAEGQSLNRRIEIKMERY